MKNIKLFAAIALFALFSQRLQAQVKVFAGAKAGLNLSTITNTEDEELNSTLLPGGIFGGFLEFNFYNRVSLQTEALFMRKGARVEFTDIATIDAKMNYLELPVLLKFSVKYSDDTDFQLYAGPSFGFFKKYKQSVKTEIDNLTAETVFDENDFQKTETSLAAGASWKSKVKTGYVTADIRGMLSLTPAIKTEAGDKFHNLGVSFSLGYCLLLNP